MIATLGAEGCSRVWIGSDLANVPSVRAFAAVGFQPVVVLDYWRLGPASAFAVTAAAGSDPDLVRHAGAALGAPGEHAVGRLRLGWRLARGPRIPQWRPPDRGRP
jgi:hypothetical protein